MKRDRGCSSSSEHLPGMWEDHGISPQDWIETPSGMKYHGDFFVILLWYMTDDSLVWSSCGWSHRFISTLSLSLSRHSDNPSFCVVRELDRKWPNSLFSLNGGWATPCHIPLLAQWPDRQRVTCSVETRAEKQKPLITVRSLASSLGARKFSKQYSFLTLAPLWTLFLHCVGFRNPKVRNN